MSQAINNYNTLCYIHFIRKTASQEEASSTVILETKEAWNLPSTTVSVQLPCQLNWVATRPGVQVIASVQLLS